MKVSSRIKIPAILTASVCLSVSLHAATFFWNWTNGVSADMNWSDSLNWSPNGVPANGDTVIFNNTNAVAGAGLSTVGGGINDIVFANFNNVVDPGFGGIISSVIYSNVAANYNNTYITNGGTLNVTNTGGFVSGSSSLDFGTTTALTTIAGSNATLNITNTNAIFFVGLGTAGTGSPVATLDLSALGTLTVGVSRFMVGDAYASTSAQNRPGGILYLAATNTITAEYQTGATETSDTVGTSAFDVGDTTSNNGGDDYLYLGQVNTITADTITVARQKVSHGLLQFNPAFPNSIATIGGFTNSRVTTWSIGDGVVNTGTASAVGVVDFSLGTVNAQVTTLYLGRAGATGTGGGAAAGTLSIGGGTFNVSNAYVGYQPTANTAGKTGTGTLNVESGSGTVIVNNNLYMANCATAGDATGTLNITNGTVLASNIVAGAGSSTISIFGGNLVVTNSAGTSTAGLTTLNLSNATLQVSAAGGVVPIMATNVNADYSDTDRTTLNVTTLPILTSFPAIIPLIQSPNAINLQNGVFSFVLGSLPSGYAGQIIQGGANNNVVELQVNSGPNVPSLWTGADIIPNHNTNWSDVNNWSTASVPGANTLVVFNSTAAQASSALSTPGGGPGAILTSKLNNIANGNFTVTSLTYTNTGGSYENTSIAAGDVVTLSSGALMVGSPTLDVGNTTGNVTISGAGGTLNAASISGNLYVGMGTATAASTPQATLDLSGLGTFISSNSYALVGVGGYSAGYTIPQPSGIVYLAETNLIYALSGQADVSDSSPVALEVGDADTLAGLPSTLYLGWSNAIYSDNIAVARQLASGGIFFNPAVTNAAPSVYIRGYSANTVANWTIGDGALNPLTLSGSGTNDFTGGTVNAMVNTLSVAVASTGSMSITPIGGTLTFEAGTINANTVNISYNNTNAAGGVFNYGVGTVNVNGTGALIVNNTLNLAYTQGILASSIPPTGVLNIKGGAVWASNIVAGTNGAASTINVTAGTLAVSNTAGTASALLTSLDITNATLDLAALGGAASVAVSTLNVGGAGNTINLLSFPVLASYPVTFTLIQAATPMNAYNLSLGTLPAASPAYAGSLAKSADGTSVVLTVTAGPIGLRPSVLWSGADVANLNTNWSDRLNWQLPGAPGPADIVIFNDTASVGGSPFGALGGGPGGIVNPNNINNIVDQNVTVASLTFTNVGSVYQNTLIDKNVTLTTSNLAAGSSTVDYGSAAAEFVTITGLGGTLNVSNPAAVVFVGLQGAADNAPAATLDLSGLGTFTATVSNFAVGALASTATYPSGVLYLAQTNTITATGGAPAETGQDETLSLLVGETGKGGTTESFLYLGQVNTFNVNTLGIGVAKQTAAMQFNSGLTGTPVAVFRAADGVSPVSTWAVGDGLAQTGTSTSPSGTADFTGGSVNALVSTMYLGRTPNASGGHPSTGVLTFGAGTFSVATLYAGYQSASDTDNGVGTVNVNGTGTLVVSGTMYLGVTAGNTGATTTSGTLDVTNGTVLANTIVPGSNSISTINLYGGLLVVTNPVGNITTPLTSLNLSPSTAGNIETLLQIASAGAGNAALTVGTLAIDGLDTTTNVINVSAMPPIAAYPAEVPLIAYTTYNSSGGLLNIGLGTLPSSAVPYVGSILQDTVSNTIALLVSSGPVAQPVTWDGGASATWNVTDADWRPASGPDTTYNDTDGVTFDDSLTTGRNTITIAAAERPGSVTFNNSATNTYTFTGSGGIAGLTGLNVFSNGTVILDNSGGNTFTGPITITNGTLQIGNNDANGTIAAGVTNTSPGVLAFNRTDNLTYAGVLSGSGALVNNGAGVLTLTGNNTGFSGGVAVHNGTLQPGSAAALGTGITTVSPGGTLDINGLNLEGLQLQVSGAGFGGNGAIVNSGAQQIDALSNVTVLADTTFGGPDRWDIRGTSTASATLKANGSPVTITKVGTNQTSIVYCNASDVNLENVLIEQGSFAIQTTSTQFGDPNGLVTVSSNANLEVYGLTAGLTKNILLLDGGQIWSENNQTVIAGTIFLTNNSANTAPGTGIITNDADATGDSLVVASVIAGPGNLFKTGAGTTVLSNVNTYTGATTVAAGALVLSNTGSIASSSAVTIAANATLDATGRGDLTFTVPSGQTLQCGGTIKGLLTAQSGSTVAAGTPAATGTLTAQSTVTLQGTTLMKINNAAGGTNDVILSQNAGITYGGALQISNIGLNAFTNGQTFQLFSAPSGYQGLFTSVGPAPGAGLAWSTNNLTVNGTVSVVTAAVSPPLPATIQSAKLSGGNLVMTGSGGLANGTYYVLTSTNAGLALSNWTRIATNSFDSSGDFSVTNAYSGSDHLRCYVIDSFGSP